FLEPEKTKSHGRAILLKEALQSDLKIQEYDLKSAIWKLIYEIFVRTNHYVKTEASKCVESVTDSFVTTVVHMDRKSS
ncbi:unnamed protein product, partial [marine sediment metagenome]